MEFSIREDSFQAFGFLLRDEPKLDGWQSGVMDAAGKKKLSYATFRALPR